MALLWKIILGALLCSQQLQLYADVPKYQWTILVYMQADNDLAPFAKNNIQSMKKVSYKDDVAVLVHWNKLYADTFSRFKIEHAKHREDSTSGGIPAKAVADGLIDAVRWAVTSYPAEHYMLVLWNHGTGILDHSLRHRYGFISNLSWLEIPGLPSPLDRGILYSTAHNIYLNNHDLAECLRVISDEILGRKIDIIGMDACLMAMLEVGYQIKDYANLFVSSQNVEAGMGWYYEELLRPLTEEAKQTTPLQLCKQILFAYNLYYKPRLPFYTQSVLDLSQMSGIVAHLDQIVLSFYACCTENSPDVMWKLVHLARRRTLKFGSNNYLDLYDFFEKFAVLIKNHLHGDGLKKNTLIQTDSLSDLMHLLHRGMHKIKQAVLGNVAGSSCQRAQGLSLYFPPLKSHASYLDTRFSQNSLWVRFLNDYHQHISQ